MTIDRVCLMIRIAGLICLASFGVICFLSAEFTADTVVVKRPLLLVLSCFAVASSAYLAVMFVMTSTDKRLPNVWELFLWGLVFRVVVWPSLPIQEVDIYRYIWDGAVSKMQVNPYRFPPDTVIQAAGLPIPLEEIEDRQLRKLVKALRTRDGLRSVATKVHYAYLTTPYPPVSQAVFHLAENLAGPASTEAEYLLTHKAVIVCFDILTALVMIVLLKQLDLPKQWFVAWWWCPLVLKEFANSGHLDSIAVFLTTLSLLLLVMGVKSPGQSNVDDLSSRQLLYCLSSGFVLALAVGAKLYPIVLAPLWFVILAKRWRWHVLTASVIFLVSSVAILWPMLAETRFVQVNLAKTEAVIDQPILVENDLGAGIEAFQRYWEMNDLLFLSVVENLKPDDMLGGRRSAWFVFVPNSVRQILRDYGATQLNVPRQETPFLLTRIMFAGLYLCVVLLICWRVFFSDMSPREMTSAVFLILAWLWFLSPVQNPWYWTWALPFLPASKNRTWYWVSGLALVYYLRFWFEGHFNNVQVWGTDYVGTTFFDFVIPWFEFGPFLLVLLLTTILSRRQQLLRTSI